MREALFCVAENDRIRCRLCPHNCLIPEGRYGICRHRKNIEGKLFADGYGKVSSVAIDPIEKKPLYHFHPGGAILSVGGLWCNLRCSFCQNWHISQMKQATTHMDPGKLLDMSLEYNSVGIAFTYNEPIIWYEYVLDTARLFKEKGLKTVMVTNGFIRPEPLEELLSFVDAFNIDVKAFNAEFYKKICGGDLAAVKQTVEMCAKKSHVEVTTLIIGSLNDDVQEIKGLARWLAEIDKNIPLHLSRYHPDYHMELPATPVDVLHRLRSPAGEYLNYVYIGNVIGADNNTYCPECGNKIVERGYYISITGLKEGKCSRCKSAIPITM